MQNKIIFLTDNLKKSLAIPQNCDINIEGEILIVSFSNDSFNFLIEVDIPKEEFCFLISSINKEKDVVFIYPLYFDNDSYLHVNSEILKWF